MLPVAASLVASSLLLACARRVGMQIGEDLQHPAPEASPQQLAEQSLDNRDPVRGSRSPHPRRGEAAGGPGRINQCECDVVSMSTVLSRSAALIGPGGRTCVPASAFGHARLGAHVNNVGH